jgi:cytidylate kinase
MPIVTISRETGAGATYIALKIAQALGGTCLDKELIHQVAAKMGKNQDDIRDFDQDTYSRIGVFFQEALASIAHGGRVFHPFGIGPLDWEGVEMFTPYPAQDFRQEEYIDVLRSVMTEMAGKGNMVFLGRGAAHVLKEFPGSFHIRVVADLETRRARLVDEQKITPEKADELIRQRDEAARKFVYDFFDLDWNDPHHYHLTLNTSRIAPDDCVALILRTLPTES